MSTAARLWIAATYHAAFRYGGWGFVCDAGGRLSGAAGGERSTTAHRIDLASLIAGLGAAPAPAEVIVKIASPSLLALGRLIANPPAPGSEGAPAEDLDLWAKLKVLTAGRAVRFAADSSERGSPLAFAAAWAEAGQDRAKTKSPFTAQIPKSNLSNLKLD